MGILLTEALPEPSLDQVLAISGGLIVLYSILTFSYYNFFHPLAKVPGPKLYAVTQLPYLYYMIKGDWNFRLLKLHEQYGPTVRFTPNDVSFITAEASKTIYNHKSGGAKSFQKDMRMYRQGRPASEIITANNDDHKRMRRLLSHAFSQKALRSQEVLIYHYVELFVQGLAERSRRGETIDIVAWFNFATFDLIGHLALGQPFGCLETGKYHPWVNLIFNSMKPVCFSQACVRLGLQKWTSFLTPKMLTKIAEEHMQFTEHAALARIDANDANDANGITQDFMSYILRHNDNKGLSKAEIVENTSTLIIAGSETTATLLSGATYLLLKNRDKLEKLTNEVRSTFISEEEITLSRVDQLKYLLAVFNEALRFYPPVPIGLSRLTPTGGELINGYWIPENTAVSVPHWTAYHSATNFRDPDMFVPERWLGDDRYANDSRSILQPFSMGPRDCIGKNLAHTEMRILLTRLLWRFDIELVGDENWLDQKIFLFWEKEGLSIKLTDAVRENA